MRYSIISLRLEDCPWESGQNAEAEATLTAAALQVCTHMLSLFCNEGAESSQWAVALAARVPAVFETNVLVEIGLCELRLRVPIRCEAQGMALLEEIRRRAMDLAPPMPERPAVEDDLPF
jgi:hypothetical protein